MAILKNFYSTRGVIISPGSFAKPTPATQVMEIVEHIPRALEDILYKNEGIREQICV